MPAIATLFSVGFRPFFLLAGAYSAVAVGAWSGWLADFGGWGEVYPPAQLHAHEMLFGFALAAVAGFQLTAVPQWTGAAPLRGPGLAALAGAWLAGRLGVLAAGVLGPVAAMVLDLLFPLGLLVVIGSMLLGANNRRNYIFIVLLSVISLANLCWHLDMMGVLEGSFAGAGDTALNLMLNLLLIMITVIGGRVIPLFSANWLKRQGRELTIHHPAWLQGLCLGGLVAVTLAELFAPWLEPDLMGAPIGALALATGLAHLARLWGWGGYRTLAHPLVWIMHLGYLWLCLAIMLKGGSYLGDIIPPAAARHAAGVGAIGTMIMAIMPRVCLGHTGRDLILPRPMLAAYALIVAAPLLRVASPFLDGDWYQAALLGSGLCWTLAFALFVWCFAPMLCAPRAD